MAGDSVLIVDDNAMNLKLAAFTLAQAGYDVHTAVDGEGMRSVLQRIVPQLILMDVQLPDGNGYDLTRELRADRRTRDIIVVALTAQALVGEAANARAAGCDGFISKPIDTARFPAEVRSYLDAKGGR
jgi:two-component system cell cycle response regulator